MPRYQDYPKKKREYYENMLQTIGSLSRLFSENSAPYLDSRIAENLYCKSFDADNKGRDDSSVDAVHGKNGIGIKTFVGGSHQKIAEFNKELLQLKQLQSADLAKKIAELRNLRIEFTKRRYGIDDALYHCIVRENGKMTLIESPMDLIDIPKIKIVKSTEKSLHFEDGKNKYSFNASKSVLLKSFPKNNISAQIDVEILADPFGALDEALAMQKKIALKTAEEKFPEVVLPLYSTKNGEKVIQERSGLNQWNAEGRPRDLDEVYIPVPAWIHKEFSGFFPKRETKFILRLPDGGKISAKICQDNGKALMSDPNKALGRWILRKVLQVKKKKLLTYKLLQKIGIDSVVIRKVGVLEYSIDFKEEGGFDAFAEENLKPS